MLKREQMCDYHFWKITLNYTNNQYNSQEFFYSMSKLIYGTAPLNDAVVLKNIEDARTDSIILQLGLDPYKDLVLTYKKDIVGYSIHKLTLEEIEKEYGYLLKKLGETCDID